jgi:hypothetical protein
MQGVPKTIARPVLTGAPDAAPINASTDAKRPQNARTPLV